jgi:ABC-type antimicrobial peptide transport system permease subunit
MYRNYFIAAWRNLIRHKAYSVINILGLSIGMTCSFFIFLWVQHEKSYDRFHSDANKIYRIVCETVDSKYAITPAPLASEIRSVISEVDNTVRISLPRTHVFQVGSKMFEEKKIVYADSTFLQVFTFPLIEGDPTTALMRPDAIIITQTMAEKYFGRQQALGKVLKKDNGENLVVTGIIKNLPSVSHLQFDAVIPLSSIVQTDNDLKNNIWDHLNYYTYVLVNHELGPDRIKQLETRVNGIFKAHIQESPRKAFLRLQSLSLIHLHSNYQFDAGNNGDIQYVNIFFVVAVLILTIACINYTNLATAKSARRAKEVGLRKVIGANRKKLIVQFLSESMMFAFLALFLAIGLIYLFLPVINYLAKSEIDFNLLEGKWLSIMFAVAVICGFASGIYPALFLSRFQPIAVLKLSKIKGGGHSFFRHGLVVIQFVFSIVLLIGTWVAYKQLKYIREMDIGFNKSNLLYFQMQDSMWRNQDALKAELRNNPLTADFTIVDDLPSNVAGGISDVQWPGKDPNTSATFAMYTVNEDFFKVMEMSMKAGRAFSTSFPGDTNNYILNEAAVKAMGLNAENAVGIQLAVLNNRGTVVGVVKNFNYKSAHNTIEPLIISLNRWGGIVMVRTLPSRTQATINALSAIHLSFSSKTPFSFGFLDERIANFYQMEKNMGTQFKMFALLAIVLSCLGLYGLSAFLAEQRAKEIGIRRVFGASITKIIVLVSSNIVKLILIAILIAIPIAWWGVNNWLQTFAYRIEDAWTTFIGAAFAALTIGLVTVSYETLKAAISNPVKTLRAE